MNLLSNYVLLNDIYYTQKILLVFKYDFTATNEPIRIL